MTPSLELVPEKELVSFWRANLHVTPKIFRVTSSYFVAYYGRGRGHIGSPGQLGQALWIQPSVRAPRTPLTVTMIRGVRDDQEFGAYIRELLLPEEEAHVLRHALLAVLRLELPFAIVADA